MLPSFSSKLFCSSFALLLCPSTSPSLIIAWYLISQAGWVFVEAFWINTPICTPSLLTNTSQLHLCWLFAPLFPLISVPSRSSKVGSIKCYSPIITTALYNPLKIRSVWHCNSNSSRWQPISACSPIITTTSRAVLLGNFKCRQSFNQQ